MNKSFRIIPTMWWVNSWINIDDNIKWCDFLDEFWSKIGLFWSFCKDWFDCIDSRLESIQSGHNSWFVGHIIGCLATQFANSLNWSYVVHHYTKGPDRFKPRTGPVCPSGYLGYGSLTLACCIGYSFNSGAILYIIDDILQYRQRWNRTYWQQIIGHLNHRNLYSELKYSNIIGSFMCVGVFHNPHLNQLRSNFFFLFFKV